MTLHLLEPELEDLLQSIATDPRATLLKVDRPALTRGLFDRSPLVRDSCTQLTTAERHLLKVHRVRLGELLRSACIDLLLGKNEEARIYGTNWNRTEYPDWLDAQQVQDLEDIVTQAQLDHPLRSAVFQAVASSDPLHYAAVSCRILPSSAGYLLLSDSYELAGHRTLELRSVQVASTLASTRKERAHVCSYLAYEHVKDSEYLDGIRGHRAAFELGGGWPNEALSWLCLAVQASNERLYRGGVDALDESEITPDAVRAWAADQVALRKCGVWSPTRDSLLFWRRHRENANNQVRHVLDSLFTI